MKWLLFALLVVPAFASAQEKTATLDVMVIEASKKDGTTDPKLERIKGEFGEFSYKSFKLLSEQSVSVKEKGTAEVSLPNGKKLSIGFTKLDKSGRAMLKLTIPGVLEKGSVSLAPGGSVPLGGSALPHGDGVLFARVQLSAIK